MNVNILNPGIWLAALLSALAVYGAGMYSGIQWEKGAQAKNTTKQMKVARANEQGAVIDVNAEAVKLKSDLAEQKRRSDNEISNLKKKLAAMPDCRVSGDVVGMLDPGDDSVPGNPATRQRTSGGTAPPDSTCAVELETCARNYREVCIPNARKVKGLQSAYNLVRNRYNSAQ